MWHRKIAQILSLSEGHNQPSQAAGTLKWVKVAAITVKMHAQWRKALLPEKGFCCAVALIFCSTARRQQLRQNCVGLSALSTYIFKVAPTLLKL